MRTIELRVRIGASTSYALHGRLVAQWVSRLCNGQSGYISGQGLVIRAEHVSIICVHVHTSIKIIVELLIYLGPRPPFMIKSWRI